MKKIIEKNMELLAYLIVPFQKNNGEKSLELNLQTEIQLNYNNLLRKLFPEKDPSQSYSFILNDG